MSIKTFGRVADSDSIEAMDSSRPLKDESDDEEKDTLTNNTNNNNDINTDINNDNDNDNENFTDRAEYALLKLFSKIIVPYFCIVFIIALACLILTLVMEKGKILYGLIIFLTTLVSVFIATWGTFKFGTIEMHIQRFKKQNNAFSLEIEDLRKENVRLKSNVQMVHKSVGNLKRESTNLDENIAAFDELRESLQDIAGDHEDMNKMINNLLNMSNNMRELSNANMKAQLLNQYYEFEFRDDNAGMSRNEYKRFLNCLDNETRLKFENAKSFRNLDVDGDGNIDVKEFQNACDIILNDNESNAINQLNQDDI